MIRSWTGNFLQRLRSVKVRLMRPVGRETLTAQEEKWLSAAVTRISRAGFTADEAVAGMRCYLEMTEIRLTNGGIQ